ncbi:poly [ADP-ribose] polymerase 11-like [Orbicella faveolata]|uniref:poly [ADP-ribose] polymerase 11-like n=1 Tax=Orbicella faveolata TaxID=48498 RepID=UPI0009E32556|nr:poly [ADP-ribose] polymerase 11-like [Orbicella faveolata]
MLGQGKTKAMYQFLTPENVYKVFFDSTRKMYQVNVRTRTKRQVKRRPEKPISYDDLNEWARGDSTSKRKIEESSVKTNIYSHVPSHWSSMPFNAPCTRVALDAASAEFQEVKKLFFRSMNSRVVIDNIDRVQNPLMWEEYCRSKEKMMRKAQLLNRQQVNEKKLFHGTSPENVEAICEKNFDPRLHNKNKMLKLGQGTYFAVNAIYSHSYAKRDSDLFQYMFLAKVLVGCYTKGHPSYQSPPGKDFANVDTHLYDSCVDEIVNPTIFVVFDANHFYPEYIIKYSSVCQPSSPPFAPPLPVPFFSEIASVYPIGTFNNLGAACYPSGSFSRRSYSALTVCSSEVNGVSTTYDSYIVETSVKLIKKT